MTEFGEKLKGLREEKGITQQTLAEQLYVTRQAVSRWECGARYPDLLTAKKIATILETTIDALVSGEECRRDVEKEPVLATPKYTIVQIALYAIGMIPFLLMCLFSIKSLFPDEALQGTPAGQITVWTFVTILEYLVKMIAMSCGLFWAMRNDLKPRKIGFIMSMPFLAEAVNLSMMNIRELISENMTVGFIWPEVIWRLAAAVCIICFFAGNVPKFGIRNSVLPILIYGFALCKIMILLQALRKMLIFCTELGYAVRTVRILGEVAIIILLVFQTYILSKKRRMAEMKKTL